MMRLRSFRTRITDWATPSLEVFEEPIIVCVKEKRERMIGERKIEWLDEMCFDHFGHDVVRFEDLIEHKKALGYTVSVRDAVMAYMLVFEWGRVSVITGFLQTYPEWKGVDKSTVGEVLSRLAAENIISPVTIPPKKAPPEPYYVPRPPSEALYHLEPEFAERQKRKLWWWER